jgi:AcrR family transcriptional regulator
MAQGDLTRQRLLRAALELFTTQGFHPTTTPLIAKKAGVAEGTIYRHFPGKRELWNELYRGSARWALGQVAAADGGGGAARDKLQALGRTFVACAAQDPGVIRLLFLQRPGDLLDERSREVGRELRHAIEKLVAQGKAQGAVRTGSAELWAGVWLATLSHALEKVCAREWQDGQSATEQVLEAAWLAIAGTPSSGAP